MPRSQLIAEHLPLLRRYARALTGSQPSGDAYVDLPQVTIPPALLSVDAVVPTPADAATPEIQGGSVDPTAEAMAVGTLLYFFGGIDRSGLTVHSHFPS